MSPTKTPVSPRNYSYEEIRKKAFGSPDHPVTLADLRVAAYARKAGKSYPREVEIHLRTCDQCQHELQILFQTDPLLTGEDERLRVLIHAVGDAAAEAQVREKGEKALSAAVGEQTGLASAAAALFKSFFRSDASKK